MTQAAHGPRLKRYSAISLSPIAIRALFNDRAVYLNDAKPGILEVRYFQMLPRLNYGSNVAANWGHLYKEFDETERVTIYKLDDNHQTASAIYAYDNTGSYAVPGKITSCPHCDRSQRLMGCSPRQAPLRHCGVADVRGRVSTIP